MFVVFSILVVVVCLGPGVAKLAGHPMMRDSAARFGIDWPRYRLIGVAELVAAAGVLVGLAWRTAGLAAGIGMLALLIGALVTHRRAHDSLREAAPALVALGVTVAYLVVAWLAR